MTEGADMNFQFWAMGHVGSSGLKLKRTTICLIMLERTYKPHYYYQNISPLANGTDLNREKYAILQTHWH